jgi:hypothetical protein
MISSLKEYKYRMTQDLSRFPAERIQVIVHVYRIRLTLLLNEYEYIEIAKSQNRGNA